MSWVKLESFDTVIPGRIMHNRVVPGGLEQRLCAIREQYDTQTLRLRSRDASIFGPLSSSLEGRILSLMIETGPKVPLRSPTPARVLVDGSCDCSAARCWEVHVLARKGGYGLHSIPR